MRDRRAEYERYYAKHKEKLKAKYHQNKESSLKRLREWRSKHREENREYQRKYRLENKERVQENDRKRIKRNPKAFKLTHYKSTAKQRGIVFDLTVEQFHSFWQKDCHYCGRQVETIGIDRVDNSRGYVLDNVVSCCTLCNRMKMHNTVDQFLSHVRAIASHQITKQVKEKIPVDNKV